VKVQSKGILNIEKKASHMVNMISEEGRSGFYVGGEGKRHRDNQGVTKKFLGGKKCPARILNPELRLSREKKGGSGAFLSGKKGAAEQGRKGRHQFPK